MRTEKFTVPAIFYSTQDSLTPHCGKKGRKKGRKIPTVIACNGYDGSQEELYHALGRSVLDRGWNFVTFEGPGQPTVRRDQNPGFIPNWWDVVTPVVDCLETRDDVDMDALALYGISFGGTLAPRAASRERRLAAGLAIDGIIDLRAATLKKFPPELIEIFDSGNKPLFDRIMLGLEANTSTPTALRWIIGESLFAFNTRSPFDWLTQLGQYGADTGSRQNHGQGVCRGW